MVAKTRKLLGYTEFATIAQRDNDGKVKIKAFNSVNKPIKHGLASDTRLIAKTRVEVNEIEDKNIDGDCMYSKSICVKQKDNSGDNLEESNETEYNEHAFSKDVFTKGEKFLKNMVDNILADNRTTKLCLVAIAIIAGIALGKSFGML